MGHQVSDALALRVRGARKAFGGVRALAGVDLEVRPAEVHALLGENGAGKSTLIKVLAGVLAADAGTVEVEGRELPRNFTPRDAANAGLRFVHQDFGLIDTMSVLENIAFVAGFPTRAGLIDYHASAAQAHQRLAELALDIPPTAIVGDLPHAEKAIIALARAMEGNAGVIVLDEPTAALPTPDAARLHRAVRAAKAKGVAFIYVTHRLEEIFSLCDRVTVLRDGCTVASAAVADIHIEQVIQWVAGKSVGSERRPSLVANDAPIRVRATGLADGLVTTPFDLSIRAGEIVGITGIIGSGYDRVCEWIGGMAAAESGAITLEGQNLRMGSPKAMRGAGCEIVVGDRVKGAFPDLSVRENLFAEAVYCGPRGWPSLERERKRAADLVALFGVRPRDAVEAPIRSLSGGNQQKVLFARALMHDPAMVVLIDPTAGVDVGARAELHDLLRAAAAKGTAALIGSSDFEEVAAICNRVLVVRDGAVRAELTGDEVRMDRLFSEAHAADASRTAHRLAAEGRA
jgi:ribose transport system ATP-binding protein